MNTVFLDESGFTGSNLCDLDQPVFSLASHCIPEEESKGLKNRFFSDFQGRELKYSRLAQRPANQRMVLDFLAYLRERRQDTRIAFAYKPFVLLCKGIDWIVEPNMRRSGIDLYERGANLALANMIYHVSTSLGGAEYYGRLLGGLQKLLREPGRESFVELCEVLAERIGVPPMRNSGTLADALGYLYYPLLAMPPDDAHALTSSNLEFAFSLTICVMHKWKVQLGPGMTLVHDATSAMSRQRHYWDALMSPHAPADLIGYDRRTMDFPIGIAETRFERSENWAGLQLADVMAGAVAECMAAQMIPEEERDPFVRNLWDRLEGWDDAEHIWPEAKFTPEALGTDGPAASNGLEYMGRIFHQADQGRGR